MTNGEKFKEIFSITQVDEGVLYAYAWLPNHNAAEFSIDWWNAEYNEPVIRDNGVKNEINRVKNELEPTTKNDLGVDCISRAYIFNRIKGIDHDEDYECDEYGGNRITYHTCDWDEVLREIEDAPSVTPIRPKGHWIFDKERLGYWTSTCSECEHIFHGNEVLIYKPKFCANCGARMFEPQESEDKG